MMRSCVLAAHSLTPSLGSYFEQCDPAGKVIVFVLLGLSLAAWTIMIGKYFELQRLRLLNQNLENRLLDVPKLLDVTIKQKGSGQGSYARLLAAALDAYARAKKSKVEREPIVLVETALQRALAEQTLRYEAKMVFLGSVVSGAPFLGLLGTVWGVMDAFGSVALEKNATIQTLAPGVSGALLATAAGLLVAIPAVFGYNYLLTMSKMMVIELENFASTTADRFRLELEGHD